MNKLYPRLKKKKNNSNLYRMNGEKDFGTHKTILIAIIYNMKLMSIYGRPSIIRKTKNSSFKNEKSKKEVDVTITVSNKDIV